MSSAITAGVIVWVAVNLVHVTAQLATAHVFGVVINRISLGLGPTLWSRTVGDTTYRLSALPVAIIVRLRAPWSDDQPPPVGDLTRHSALVQLAVFGSAPLAVLLLALVSGYWLNGLPRESPVSSPTVGAVQPNGPADQSGVKHGDVVRSVGGQAINGWDDIKPALNSLPEGPVEIQVERNGELLRFPVSPVGTAEGNGRRIGIWQQMTVEPPPTPPMRLVASFKTIGGIYAKTGAVLARLVVGEVEQQTVGGPVVLHAAPQRSALDEQWTLRTSVTIAIANYFLQCLYFPYLDGVRLLFVGVAALRRGRLHRKYEERFNKVLLLPFVPLLLLILKNDFVRLLR